jgi:hypothetical protein
MDLYLYTSYKHHPSQKLVVVIVYVQHANTICDDDSLDVEMSHLKKIFRFNQYSHRLSYVLVVVSQDGTGWQGEWFPWESLWGMPSTAAESLLRYLLQKMNMH